MSVVFVGGCQRTGTSMLHTLLCQDDSVNPPINEAKYLQTLVLAYHIGLADFEAKTRDYFGDRDAFRRFHGGVVGQFLERVRSRFPGRDHLCLKEPHLTMLFPDVATLVPEARFVCIVRDPRDVIASMIRVGERLHATGVDDAMGRVFLSRDIESMVAYLHSFYAPSAGCTLPGFRERCAFLRYEDLVRDPAGMLTCLRDFTGLSLAGIDPAADPVGARPDPSTDVPYERAWVTPLFGRAVNDSRIGGFRAVLSADEEARVQKGTAAFRATFGYPD